MKKYFFAKTKSIGQAYVILNELSKEGWELFEVSPVGGGGHLVLFNSSESAAPNTMFVDSCEHAACLQISDEVIETYLSLKEAPLKDVLLILEHDFIGDIFKIAEDLYRKGFDLLDLRFAKGYQQKAHLFVSFNKGLLSVSSNQIKEFQDQGFLVTQIDQISAELRNLFESVQPVNDSSQPKS